MSTEDHIYIGAFSYRKASLLATGICLIAVAFALWMVWLRSVRHDLSFLALPAFFLCIGIAMLLLYFRRTSLTIAFDQQGITYGETFVPWDRVRRVRIHHLPDDELHFIIQRQGFRADLHLTIDAPAPDTNNLERFLLQNHPETYSAET
jgi:hypothetical protein